MEIAEPEMTSTKRQATYEIFNKTGWATPESRMRPGGLAIPGWLRLAEIWIERSRNRRALAKLDDHLLRDIGISRARAEREAAKPFWG